MVNYQCYRCNYIVKDKSKMRIHLRRKNPCKPNLSNINIDQCKEDILNGVMYNDYLEKVTVNKKTTIGQRKVNGDGLIFSLKIKKCIHVIFVTKY